MLIDHRTYHIKPGHTRTHLDIYEKYGYKAQARHLGEPVLYMFAESGAMNTIVHNWAYEDAADRAKRRAGMMADPEWKVYLQKLVESDLLVGQQTSLMIPTGFCKINR